MMRFLMKTSFQEVPSPEPPATGAADESGSSGAEASEIADPVPAILPQGETTVEPDAEGAEGPEPEIPAPGAVPGEEPGAAQEEQDLPSVLDSTDYGYGEKLIRPPALTKTGVPSYTRLPQPEDLVNLETRAFRSKQLIERMERRLRRLVEDSLQQVQIIENARENARVYLKGAKASARKADAIVSLERRLEELVEKAVEAGAGEEDRSTSTTGSRGAAEAEAEADGDTHTTEILDGGGQDVGLITNSPAPATIDSAKDLQGLVSEIASLRAVPLPAAPPDKLVETHTLETFFN